MSEENKLDAQAARAAIEADRQQRANECAERIQAVLEELRCVLQLSIVKVPLGSGAWGDSPRVQVAARD